MTPIPKEPPLDVEANCIAPSSLIWSSLRKKSSAATSVSKMLYGQRTRLSSSSNTFAFLCRSPSTARTSMGLRDPNTTISLTRGRRPSF